MTTLQTGFGPVTLQGDPGPFRPTLARRKSEDGLEYVTLRLEADAPHPPPPLTLGWSVPVIDIHSRWTPNADWNRGQSVDWGAAFSSKATANAPVVCLLSRTGKSRHTFAFSDALNPAQVKAGITEEAAEYSCGLSLFTEPGPPIQTYEATLRLDGRDLFYADALREVSDWWARQPGYTPAPVPDAARLPMYSTWYSFHQHLTTDGVEAQCRIAKDMGCDAVIVDDGWQTLDAQRGYAYCGDWTPDRLPDMAAHVARVHEIGLKYLLWYSVPFVGVHTKAFAQFEDKFLRTEDWHPSGHWGILDPRFPEVREYLIGLYETALRDWDLDGFKLDFVDSFSLSEDNKNDLGRGRDHDSVPEAADRLLSDVIARLRAIKPEILIEFRQSYVGPLMRKYGNMFRAADCPNDAATNRIRTLDIRLLCGQTAAHADMFLWNPNDPVEIAATQLIHTLFAVPQVSVLLDLIPTEHQEMIRWWLNWWRENRDVLLDGRLTPLHPELHYPAVIAADGAKCVLAAYADTPLPLSGPIPDVVWLVNGTETGRVLLETAAPLVRRLTVRDCRGRVVREETVRLASGLHPVAVPPSGTACLTP